MVPGSLARAGHGASIPPAAARLIFKKYLRFMIGYLVELSRPTVTMVLKFGGYIAGHMPIA